MTTVRYKDGTTFTFPEPKGANIQQIGKRLIALTENEDQMTELELGTYIDDMIYLLLDYWKAHNVEQPFQRLYKMVDEGIMDYRTEKFKELYENRIRENHTLIKQYGDPDTDPGVKATVKTKLKARGFIGTRKVSVL